MRKATRIRAIHGDNPTAAAIILADPVKWGGEKAGLVQWARLWQKRDQETHQNANEGQKEACGCVGSGRTDTTTRNGPSRV